MRNLGTVTQDGISEAEIITKDPKFCVNGLYADLGVAGKELLRKIELYVGSGCGKYTEEGFVGLLARVLRHEKAECRERQAKKGILSFHHEQGYKNDDPHTYVALWAATTAEISSFLGVTECINEQRIALCCIMEEISIVLLGLYVRTVNKAAYETFDLPIPYYEFKTMNQASALASRYIARKDCPRTIAAVRKTELKLGVKIGRPVGERATIADWRKWAKEQGIFVGGATLEVSCAMRARTTRCGDADMFVSK